MKKHLTILLLACAALLAHAQTTLNQSSNESPSFAQLTPEQMGGTFYAYPAPKKVEAAPTPEGYTLAYLSHFGRHGSRYMTNDARYTWVLDHFADEQNLTAYGRKVKRQLEKVYADAKGQGGQLTTLGVKQHEGIARRMLQRFPSFLESAVAIDAHSTVVRRCRKSMEAFMSALEEELERGERNRRSAPTGKAKEERGMREHTTEHTTPLSLERGWGRGRFSLTTDSSEMVWMNHEPEEQKLLENEQVSVPTVSTDRLFGKLFRNPSIVEDKDNLFNELYAIASDLQDVEGLGVSLYHLFTREELLTSYEIACRKMWYHHGAGPESRGIPAQTAANLWANIVSEADCALASGEPRATLRFGHDSGLYKLLVLLTSETATTHNGFNLHEIVPMAANLQMAFYVEELKEKREKRKEEREKIKEGATLVTFWLNERPMRLTAVEAELTKGGQTYYSWEKVKRAFAHYIETQRWKDRTAAVNTMVGTDYAVTKTAGLYGKGSEEHGQTLPAVLAPHGMNFWTPQTRDTEKKCIAPYYYPDSLLQGFRASHWIVGGCTQDYGSFTIMPLMGQVRLDAEARATRFSHNDEVAHPYYYGVRLPDEHLTAELTASTNADGTGSRAALFRFTPTESGILHIVVDSNNDYGEGFVAIDTVRNAIVGCNPVHRIYQGWGERAGFSGHFVIQFQRPIELSHTQDSVAYVSFEVKKGEAVLVRAATSFTSLDGAWQNLQAEMPTWDFLSARLALDSVWQQQLARIDVEDDDQAKVNQFYGALYRASFLPHVLSDVDGKHPTFGQCEVSSVKGEGSNSTLHTSHSTLHTSHSTLKSSYYDDFSMWDIYRAQLPLLTITDSARVSDMAASLVTKYEQGGWMPIFPCWNSYTAAMIGDHAAAALADAWVKGIRSFDVDKAYEGVRKNAFESPATFEEYKNGMGRRALKSYLKYGYIPLEDNVSEAFHIQEQASRTLEYAYDDFCAAQLAKATGHDDDYCELMRRSGNWKNVFNPKLGWMDARHQPTDRAFKKNPQAKGGFFGNTDLTSRVPFITEGAVVHYSFYVPHDVPGLMEAMGGREKFIEKLDTLFGQCEVNSVRCEGSNSTLHTSHSTLNNSSFYWHGNEPCHHIAYLYALAGKPERTRQLVSYIMDTEYMDVPGGLSGNDDAGQMSAWYVFSAMGFYPVCPGKAEYVLGQPMFRKVRIGRLTIENKKANPTTENNAGGTICQIRYNGAPYTQPVITHDMLTREGTLTFE